MGTKPTSQNKLADLFSYIALIVLSGGCILGIMQYINGNEAVQAGGATLFVLLLVKTALKR